MDDPSGSKKATPAPRKHRSKSLGPGGLDALNAGNKSSDAAAGGKVRKRRESMMPATQVKSILLPTVPVSPIQQVARPSRRRTSLLNIPSLNMPPRPTGNSTDGVGSTTSVPLRTEEEQAAAARERQRKEVLESRAARRKSLGNRRVSFATEATLHTFVVEDFPATPSSNGGSSRNSTPGGGGRRTSGGATPVRKRRSSAAAPDPHGLDSSSDSDSNEAFSSDPIVPENELGGHMESGDKDGVLSSSDSDSDFGATPAKRNKKRDDTGPIPTGLMPSFDDDETMDLVNEETTLSKKGGFGSFFKKPIKVIKGDTPTSSKIVSPPKSADKDDEMTMDITRPVGGLLTAAGPSKAANEEDEDDGMDITRSVGGFLSSIQYPTLPQPPQDDQDMTMDMDETRPVGGLIFGARRNEPVNENEQDMDETRPVGGLLRAVEYPTLHNYQGNDNHDATVDMDMTRPVGGILQKGKKKASFAVEDETMDFTTAVGGIQRASNQEDSSDDDVGMDEQTMDLTTAIGRVINKSDPSPTKRRSGRRVSNITGVASLQSQDSWSKEQEAERQLQNEAKEVAGKDSDDDDMDMTVAVGGIMNNPSGSVPQDVGSDIYDDDDADMEFTAIIPSSIQSDAQVSAATQLSPPQPASAKKLPAKSPAKQKTPVKEPANAEPTSAAQFYGKPTTPAPGVTSALPSPGGNWIPPLRSNSGSRGKGKKNALTPEKVPELSAAAADALESPLEPSRRKSQEEGLEFKPSSAKKSGGRTSTSKGNTTGTPPSVTSARSTRSTRSSNVGEIVPTPAPTAPAPSTPENQASGPPAAGLVPPVRSQTPNKDTVRMSARRRMAGASGSNTPVRKLAGGALEMSGLGSPMVLASLTPRKLLGQASPFKSTIHTPKQVLQEEDRLAAEERLKLALENEEAYLEEKRAIEYARDESVNLKERIESMTPKKNARKRSGGIFDDEIDDSDTVGRDLFGAAKDAGNKQPPRKRVSTGLEKAPSIPPPSKTVETSETATHGDEENQPPVPPAAPVTGGRVTRSRTSLSSSTDSTPKAATAPPPKSTSSKKGKKPVAIASPEPPAKSATPEPLPIATTIGEDEDEEEVPRLTMKQFLEMTHISFLDDITHTKRRQTFAPGMRKAIAQRPSALFKKKNKDGNAMDTDPKDTMSEDREPSTGDFITAGAATYTLGALYTIGCRELRNYIDGGKSAIKTIEKGVWKYQPPLFEEFYFAPADEQVKMESQLKRVKEKARLDAKRDWYTWRMAQLNGVIPALQRALTGLKEDEKQITQQTEIIDAVLPNAMATNTRLQARLEELRERRRQLDACDPMQLAAARSRLVELRKIIEAKRIATTKAKDEVEALDKGIEERKEHMEKLKVQIDEAEKVKEANRGFSEEEVWASRERIKQLEKNTGWSVSDIAGNRLTLAYKSTLVLSFNGSGDLDPKLSFVKETTSPAHLFFLGYIQSTLLPSTTTPKALTPTVSQAWSIASTILSQIEAVQREYIVECSSNPETPSVLSVAVKVVLTPNQLSGARAKASVQLSLNAERLLSAKKSDGAVGVHANVQYFMPPIKSTTKPGQKKRMPAKNSNSLSGEMAAPAVLGQDGGWVGVVKDIVERCFVEVEEKKEKATAATTSTPSKGGSKGMRRTPKRVATEKAEKPQTAKKIPVRAPTASAAAAAAAPIMGSITVGGLKTEGADENATASGTALPASSAPAAPTAPPPPAATGTFDKVAAPFGTGKRGIPVPTKPGGVSSSFASNTSGNNGVNGTD